MITLKTNCEKCIHNKVCKNKDTAKYMHGILKRLPFGTDVDSSDWETTSNINNVNIDFSCPDFKNNKSVKMYEIEIERYRR